MTVARPPRPRLIVYIESRVENKPCFPDSVKLCKPLSPESTPLPPARPFIWAILSVILCLSHSTRMPHETASLFD